MSKAARSLISLLALGVLARPAGAAITLLDEDDWKVQIGGFAELDMINDSTRSLTEVAGNAPIARAGSVAADMGRTAFSMRNSRLAFTVLPPVSDEWKTKAYLEFDLLGYDPDAGTAAPSNSEASFYTNPTFRMRHAYLAAEKNGIQILAGQYWTLFGWQMNYVPSTVSVPPVSGTLYERTPQLLISSTSKMSESTSMQAALALNRPIQRDSKLPGLDAGIRVLASGRRAPYTMYNGDLKADPMSLGISGTARAVQVPVPGTTTSSNTYGGYGVAVDGMIPLIASDDEKDTSGTLALMGEFSAGRGYGDEYPSWSGGIAQTAQGASGAAANAPSLDRGLGAFNASGNFALVSLRSFHLSLQWHMPAGWDSFMTVGYAQLLASNLSDFGSAAALHDRVETAFVNLFHDFTKQVRAGAEYAYFQTRYLDGTFAHNTRVGVSAYLRF